MVVVIFFHLDENNNINGNQLFSCFAVCLFINKAAMDRPIQYAIQNSRVTSHVSYYYHMMMSSNGNIFRVTGHLCGELTGPGEFPAQRPVTRNFDVFFDLCLDKRLSKQSRGWWLETQSRPLWRSCNAGHAFFAPPTAGQLIPLLFVATRFHGNLLRDIW